MLNFLPVIVAATLGAVAIPSPSPAVACRPHALNKEQRQRQQELLKTVRRQVQEVLDIDNGLALRLPTDSQLFRDAAEWASLERRCCPFLAFTLEWNLDDSVWLRLTGGPGVREAISAEMGLPSSR